MLLRLVSWAPQDAGLKFLRTIINTPGIDVNHLREEDHETALTQACDRSRTDAALLLISHPGINVNLQTKSGYTALMLAAWKGNIKIVQALCEVKGIEMHHVNQVRPHCECAFPAADHLTPGSMAKLPCSVRRLPCMWIQRKWCSI